MRRLPPGLLCREAIRPAAIVATGVLSLILAAAADIVSRIRH